MQIKHSIIYTLAIASVGAIVGYTIAYVFLQHQFDWYKYSSLARDTAFYEKAIDSLDNDGSQEAKQLLITGLEGKLSNLSGCLDGFCADGRNEHTKRVYQRALGNLQQLKE